MFESAVSRSASSVAAASVGDITDEADTKTFRRLVGRQILAGGLAQRRHPPQKSSSKAALPSPRIAAERPVGRTERSAGANGCPRLAFQLGALARAMPASARASSTCASDRDLGWIERPQSDLKRWVRIIIAPGDKGVAAVSATPSKCSSTARPDAVGGDERTAGQQRQAAAPSEAAPFPVAK
jgi:hypothetical protein